MPVFTWRLHYDQLEVRMLLTSISMVPHVLEDTRGATAAVADFDNDGDLDGVSLTGRISFRENIDGKGTFVDFESEHFAPPFAGGVGVADADDDGDLDVIYASVVSTDLFGGQLGWIPNEGGGFFGRARPIANFFANIQDVAVGDVTFDSGVDIVISTATDTYLVTNLLPRGTFGELRLLAPNPSRTFISDVNGDGNEDVILSTRVLDDSFKIVNRSSWLENTGSVLDPSLAQPILSPIGDQELSILDVADLNGDGRDDLVVQVGLEEHWLSNRGNGTFDVGKRILPLGFTHHEFTDVDGDGDTDALSTGGSMEGLTWAENLGGGEFEGPKTLNAGITPSLLRVGDVDGDGDVDILFAGNSLLEDQLWFEQRLSGDVDEDGSVDFADFLNLSANFGIENAEWDDGDFDGNGKVEFADFLMLASNFVDD